MTLHPIVIFLAGLVIIIVGAEVLLRGAARLAAMLGVRPILIGLTVVSVGTSAPELAVGITAATTGNGPLAVGNIAGTNILNILFILGMSALIRPLPTRLLSIRLDVPVMIASALALIAMSLDGVLSRSEGLLLVLGSVAYTAGLIRLNRQESRHITREFSHEYGAVAVHPGHGWLAGGWNVVMLVVGMAVTVLGGELLVAGSVSLARAHGVSDAFIGLTIVAIGTSAPELATTLLSTIKGDRDVAIGNLIGSSIYNILVILGLTMMASPGGVDVSREIIWIDLPLALIVSLVCLPVFKSGHQVSRLEGGLFVLAYIAYLVSLIVLRG